MLHGIRCTTKKCRRVMDIKRCIEKQAAEEGWYWLVCPECHQCNLIKDMTKGEPIFHKDYLASDQTRLHRPPLTPPSFRSGLNDGYGEFGGEPLRFDNNTASVNDSFRSYLEELDARQYQQAQPATGTATQAGTPTNNPTRRTLSGQLVTQPVPQANYLTQTVLQANYYWYNGTTTATINADPQEVFAVEEVPVRRD